VDILKRYALAWCVIIYMMVIVLLHLFGLFPRAGIYDLSRLVGSSLVTLEGRVMEAPVIRWNQTRFLFNGHSCPLTAFQGKSVVTLNFIDEDLAPGDLIRVRGWLSSPRPASPGRDFDEQNYWATRRVFSMLKVWSPDGMTILKPSSTWGLTRLAWIFHGRYREFWERQMPWNEASLLLGMTIGARGILPAPIKEACIRAGVYHIVVVSGQNMSLIVGLGVALLLLARVQRRYAFCVCLAPIIFYTSVVGGDPPVMRAAAMSIVGLFAATLGRDIPRYYPLLLAAGWILICEPEALLGASFQLSFGATLSILAMLPLCSLHGVQRARWRQRIMEAGILGICVYLGIWPILVYYFHRVSLAGLFANWTVFPLSGLLMICGLTVGTWGVILPGTVPMPVIAFVRAGVRITLSLIEHMSLWRWSVLFIRPLSGWVVGLYYGFLFGILFVTHRRKIYAEKNPPQDRRSRLQRG
jgi:ComEC/Rec2-related protein